MPIQLFNYAKNALYHYFLPALYLITTHLPSASEVKFTISINLSIDAKL